MSKYIIAFVTFVTLLVVVSTAEAGPLRRAGKGARRVGAGAAKVVRGALRLLLPCR